MDYDEALETLQVSPSSEQEWADGGTSFATYCSEALPEPLKLYVLVEDHLWGAGAPRSARHYLNVPHGSLAGFCKGTATGSYLLAAAPERLHHIISAEVLRQSVRHTVLVRERPPTQGLFVRIGGCSFVCESATAEM